MPGDERPPRADRARDLGRRRTSPRLLERGELELLGLLPPIVELHVPRARPATGRPRCSPSTSLGGRGAAVGLPGGDALPTRRSPRTSWRTRSAGRRCPPPSCATGREGPGSVQRFVRLRPRQHFFTMQDERPDDFRAIASFDVVANNADRKSGHCLLSTRAGLLHRPRRLLPRGAQAAHGDLGFRRRRGPGRAARGSAPSPERLSEADLREQARRAALRTRDRGDADRRLADLIAAARFPEPGPDRPYPWPPV